MLKKGITVRLEEDMLHKLHIIADYEGRSANGQMLILIRDCIKDYEQNHKEIFEKFK